MSDFVWFVVFAVVFIVLGVVFIRIGWHIWKEQKMDLIISYHCDKVSEENKSVYCKRAGIGVFIIGIGLGFSGICAVVLQSVYAFIPMTVGVVLGTVLLISAIVKYNH